MPEALGRCTIGTVSELTRRKQRGLWSRARRQLREVQEAAARLATEFDELSGGLDELEIYQRSMMIIHLLDRSTDLLSHAQDLASDLQRISWIEELP